MTFGQNYKIDEGYFVEIKPGEYIASIASITERQTRNGKPMLEIKLRLENGGLISYYLVDDQSDDEASMRSNQRITKFFDCFRIKRGNFNTKQWQGAKGRVKLDYGKPSNDGSVFIEVKNLLLPQQANMKAGQQTQSVQGASSQKQGVQVQNKSTQKVPVQNTITQNRQAQNVKEQNVAGQEMQAKKMQAQNEKNIYSVVDDFFNENNEQAFDEDSYEEKPQTEEELKGDSSLGELDNIPFEPYQPHNKKENDLYSKSAGYEEPEIF